MGLSFRSAAAPLTRPKRAHAHWTSSSRPEYPSAPPLCPPSAAFATHAACTANAVVVCPNTVGGPRKNLPRPRIPSLWLSYSIWANFQHKDPATRKQAKRRGGKSWKSDDRRSFGSEGQPNGGQPSRNDCSSDIRDDNGNIEDPRKWITGDAHPHVLPEKQEPLHGDSTHGDSAHGNAHEADYLNPDIQTHHQEGTTIQTHRQGDHDPEHWPWNDDAVKSAQSHENSRHHEYQHQQSDPRIPCLVDLLPPAPLPDPSWFGPWARTLADNDQIRRELGWEALHNNHRHPPTASSPLYVSDPAHVHDMRLWTYLLDFAQRWRGDQGIASIWWPMRQHGVILPTHGPMADFVWTSFIDVATTNPAETGFDVEEEEGTPAAMGDQDHKILRPSRVTDSPLLQDILAYTAEWVVQGQEAWPSLYRRIVANFLATGQYVEALRWHTHLVNTLSIFPSPKDFQTLLLTFLLRSDVACQSTLHALYSDYASATVARGDVRPPCRFYDVLVPRLFDAGYPVLAQQWRLQLLRAGDVPQSPTAAKPFLRYLYLLSPSFSSTTSSSSPESRSSDSQEDVPETPARDWTCQLAPEEQMVLGRDVTRSPPPSSSSTFSPASPPNSPTTDDAKTDKKENALHSTLYQGLRRSLIHDTLQDSMGAKWFATSWAALDFAISIVHRLGVREIGPLSLQSLALRHETLPALRDRLAHLSRLDIRIQDCHYARLIRYYIDHQREEDLFTLLRSDIHPDVLESSSAMDHIIQTSLSVGNWQVYSLFVATRVSLKAAITQDACRRRIATCARHGKYGKIAKIIADMATAGVQVPEQSLACIFHSMLAKFSPRSDKDDVPSDGKADDYLPKSVDMADEGVKITTQHEPDHDQEIPSEKTKSGKRWSTKKSKTSRKPASSTATIMGAYHLCRRLERWRQPVPMACWAGLLHELGRIHRFYEVAEASLSLADRFWPNSSVRGDSLAYEKPADAVLLCRCDVQQIMGKKGPGDPLSSGLTNRNDHEGSDTMSNGIESDYAAVSLPLSVLAGVSPTSSHLHPLRAIFTEPFLQSLVVWGFCDTNPTWATTPPPSPKPGTGYRTSLKGAGIYRGLLLVRLLRERGIPATQKLAFTATIDGLAKSLVAGSIVRQPVVAKADPLDGPSSKSPHSMTYSDTDTDTDPSHETRPPPSTSSSSSSSFPFSHPPAYASERIPRNAVQISPPFTIRQVLAACHEAWGDAYLEDEISSQVDMDAQAEVGQLLQEMVQSKMKALK